LTADKIIEHLVPLVTRLVEGDWFTSRASASGILPDIYPHVSDDQKATFRAYVAIASPHVPTNN